MLLFTGRARRRESVTFRGLAHYTDGMQVTMQAEHDTRMWIKRAQEGDREAFEKLFGLYRDDVEAIVRRRLGGYLRQRIEAEDVLQETFLKAMQSVQAYRERGPGSFLNWLRGIAENILLYWARQHQRTNLLRSGHAFRGSDPSPSKLARREERFDRLQQALNALSPAHREIVLLARVEGLAVKDIARRLDRSPASVKQMLWRALHKLAAGFGETESFSLPPRPLVDRREDDGA